jgi:hypothetical protein
MADRPTAPPRSFSSRFTDLDTSWSTWLQLASLQRNGPAPTRYDVGLVGKGHGQLALLYMDVDQMPPSTDLTRTGPSISDQVPAPASGAL